MAGKRKRRSGGEKRVDDFLSSVSYLASNCAATEEINIPSLDEQHRKSAINELKEASLALSAFVQRIGGEAGHAVAAEDGVGKEPWRNALLRASRGDMSALAERVKSKEATDVELLFAAYILLHPDGRPKHSFKNMAEAERDREIATFVDFIASHDGEKKMNVVEQWATKEYGLSRSAIWAKIKKGRLLLSRKVKEEDATDLGCLEPDGDGRWKWIPPSPVKTQK